MLVRRPEEGLTTEQLIIAVGRSYTRRIKETTQEFMEGRMDEQQAFLLAFGRATREIDLKVASQPVFDFKPAINFTLDYFREKNREHLLAWLAILSSNSSSSDRKITPGAGMLLAEAMRRRIYPPRPRR